MVNVPNDFYEDDERAEDVVAAFERARTARLSAGAAGAASDFVSPARTLWHTTVNQQPGCLANSRFMQAVRTAGATLQHIPA